jgi:4-amino-4-deoxy-L-arabinose transferase-like glycosyltransferase
MTCPHCLQDAPTIVRGVRAYCTVCGAPRSLATAPEAVNVVGQPGQVGGAVVTVLGGGALAIGLLVALVLAGLSSLIFPPMTAVVVGGLVLLITLLVAVPLLLGGRNLRKTGDERARVARERAVFALAAQKRGVVTARDVARAVSIPEEEADALLTSLAKRPDGGVSLEVGDDGSLWYRFADLMPSTSERVRIADQPWQAPARVAQPEPAPRVIDAELIEEESEPLAPPRVRRASP